MSGTDTNSNTDVPSSPIAIGIMVIFVFKITIGLVVTLSLIAALLV